LRGKTTHKKTWFCGGEAKGKINMGKKNYVPPSNMEQRQERHLGKAFHKRLNRHREGGDNVRVAVEKRKGG